MNRPARVTVIMPAHNAGRYIAQAVASVLDQTYRDLELLVIDDGSTDETGSILSRISDPRLRVVRLPRNQGLVAALNEGLSRARGEFIARMDADDVMRPGRLEKQVRFLDDHPRIDVVAGFVDLMNPEGETTGTWGTDRATVSEAEIRAMMPRTNCIAHPTVLLRRSALRGARYDPRMTEGEDWALWLRLLGDGARIAKIPEVLLSYRQHAANHTSKARASGSLEVRLLTMRRRFLLGEWGRFRFRAYHARIIHAQARTLARYLLDRIATPVLRGAYRVLTYSPLGLLREWLRARRITRAWEGRELFVLPYLSMGGAEQVHLRVVQSVKDRAPLVVFTGFSPDRAFEGRFARAAPCLEMPRLLNHPWTRRAAERLLAAAINRSVNGALFGSLSEAFFRLLPHLEPGIRAYYMQHAFLYQPEANLLEKRRLRQFERITAYLFPSRMARDEFARFLYHQNMPRDAARKLLLAPCAAPRLGTVNDHDRIGVLFVGRDSPEKRCDLFLSIASDLERRTPGRFRFTMVGPATRASSPHVAFTGPIGDPHQIAGIYAEHDILLVTSTREGHCLVVTEAMANGLVVLSTPVGDIADRVSRDTGLLTSATDEGVVRDEMRKRILEFDGDRALLRSSKERARDLIRDRYSSELFARYYRGLLVGTSDPS